MAELKANDKRHSNNKPTFKQPDKDSLREDPLNKYIELAKVKPLNEFQV
jgi:hypothetical protein